MSLSIDPRPGSSGVFFWTNFVQIFPDLSGRKKTEKFYRFPQNGKTVKFSRIFLFGKIDFNPEKIFSGIWIIPIFGFTFVPGRRAVNATEVASFQGNSGKSDPKTESFTLWTVPFWVFAFTPLAKSNYSKN